MQEKEAVWQEIRNRVFQNMDLSGEISDKELKRMIAEEVRQFGKVHLLSLQARETCEEQIFNSFRKLDILQELLDDPEVTEIMVNGAAHIFYEKHGVLYPWEKGQLSEERLRDMIQQMVGAADRIVNEAQPIVDTRLPDGSRVNIVLQPVSLDGSCISIRKFCGIPMNLAYLVQSEAISEEAAELLKLLVKAGYNIFISGGTGSGKTTFLNALSEYIPEGERVITIEDSAELQLNNIKNLVRLETRPANGQGAQEISIRDLIRTALRMRPEGIKIKKGKLKRKKKRIPIPHTFLQHILGNLIPLIRCEVVKIIEEADDLLSFFHSILHVEGILPINGICTQHSFPE